MEDRLLMEVIDFRALQVASRMARHPHCRLTDDRRLVSMVPQARMMMLKSAIFTRLQYEKLRNLCPDDIVRWGGHRPAMIQDAATAGNLEIGTNQTTGLPVLVYRGAAGIVIGDPTEEELAIVASCMLGRST